MTVASLWSAAAAAAAQGPVAVVEEVTGKPPGVQFMDYVEAGKVIRLGPHDEIVLGYLKSCWRETISGGTVTVGTEQSTVQSGNVKRVQVKCDGGRIELGAGQGVESAGFISRSVQEHPGGGQPGGDARGPAPGVTLFARIPLIDVRPGGGTLLIERLDEPGERFEIAIQPADLVRGAFLDFARTNRVLTAGAIYRATLGAKQVVFKIDAAAPPTTASLAARLLRF